MEWWKGNLYGAPQELTLPFARLQVETRAAPAEGRTTWRIAPQVAHRLNTLSTAFSVTRNMVRLAAFAALLAMETRCSDVIIGMYTSGRTSLPLRNVFGDFSNLLTLRFRCDPGSSFVDWLAVVRDQVVRTDVNGAIPYDELCEECRAARA